MALNFEIGKIIALIIDQRKKDEEILMVDPDMKKYKSIELPNTQKFEPMIDDSGRAIYYVCGASGSGKSTLTRGLIQKFNLVFPNSQVYIFSRLNSDPAFDDLEKKGIITRIPINEDLIHNKIDVNEDIEKNSLVIFDDIDTVHDKKILSVLNNIKMQILEIGRHNNIYCIVTSHLINSADRNSTRTMMNEMHNLVIFPKGGGSAYQQRYALKNYLGLNTKQINKIMNTDDSRWVLISKNYPQYVLTEKSCYMI